MKVDVIVASGTANVVAAKQAGAPDRLTENVASLR
jgi:hypothetical protein